MITPTSRSDPSGQWRFMLECIGYSVPGENETSCCKWRCCAGMPKFIAPTIITVGALMGDEYQLYVNLHIFFFFFFKFFQTFFF